MAVAVCAVISMLGTAEGYEHSYAALYESRSVDLVVVRAGITQRIASNLDEALGERLRKTGDGGQDALVHLGQFGGSRVQQRCPKLVERLHGAGEAELTRRDVLFRSSPAIRAICSSLSTLRKSAPSSCGKQRRKC